MESQTIIIKKIKKGGHGGHHGGSWKVAYADFVTAMMAFFLLLWLITMSSPEKRAAVSNYFSDFSLFENKGTSVMEFQESIRPQASEKGTGSRPSMSVIRGEVTSGKTGGSGKGEEKMANEKVMAALKKEIETKLAEVKDQIRVVGTSEGVRVEVMEKEGSPMFPLSSFDMTPMGKNVIAVIAGTLADSKRQIAIEGHTDAHVFAKTGYSNWELSTARASAARIELEKAGLPPDQLSRVAGFAATQPLIPDNPLDPRNRRISIMVYE